MSLLVSLDATQHGLARAVLHALPAWVMSHAMRWADQLVPYLRRGATRFASVMRGRPGLHIGHQLWNELTGIDRLVREVPHALPDWIVLDAPSGIELYGPLEALFPELDGHVERSLPDVSAMIAWAYGTGTVVLRATDEFVSAAMRRRIQAHLAATPAGRLAANAIAPLRGRPIVLFGLRVENRTLVDLEGFMLRLLAALSARFPDLVLLLDGHNARGSGEGGGFIESHGEDGDNLPVDVERRLVQSCRDAASGSDVTILDTIGAPMAASIAWALAADCFVSIWGASLAKYRWVCNRPGFVISSRINLRHRASLHIYDAPAYTEQPAEIMFADPDTVTDHPEAAQLIQVGTGQASFFNFSLDEARTFAAIVSLIERCQPPGRPSRPPPRSLKFGRP